MTDAEIWRVLAKVAADWLVQGLDARIGDRGVMLSAGERQWLALARALLRLPARPRSLSRHIGRKAWRCAIA